MDLLFFLFLYWYEFNNSSKFQLCTRWFGHMALQIAHQGSWLKPETRALACDLRYLGPYHRHGLTFFLYFFVNDASIMLPSFSFMWASMEIKIACRGSWLKPETRGFTCDLRFLNLHHRCGLIFFLYFLENIDSIALRSFSFMWAYLATCHHKLRVGAHTWSLKLWFSHAI